MLTSIDKTQYLRYLTNLDYLDFQTVTLFCFFDLSMKTLKQRVGNTKDLVGGIDLAEKLSGPSLPWECPAKIPPSKVSNE